ncbi:right-handed parallel beta-helix repeat-containing protein [Pseudarthrobacter phenanthrenivorans]|uniref:right-handed parallel beta-helix repeat-containing protein n=1 Tax=Pseudarthrobacter phenanthrenivorans TaxID=361575 RepID=UPI0034501480
MSLPPATTKYRKSFNYDSRAAAGMITIMAVLLCGLGFYLSLAIAIYPQHDKGFAIVERGPYIHAYDPIALAELGLPPNSSNANALPADPEIRTISVYSDRVVLTSAGVVVSSIPLISPVADLEQLKNLLNNPAWIEESDAGTYVMKAAIILFANTQLTIGAPHVHEVQMLDVPSVFIGVTGGDLTFRDVVVRGVGTEGTNSDKYQPFVMATGNARMIMTNSLFTNLGWDWNASYGVSWEHGSTGEVTGTIFENSFIGVYTSRSERLSFIDCTFRNNHLYGLDPHTYSRNLTIDHVTAEGNGAHGIIFSDHVTDSIIKNSASFANGENGIMMDESSTNNVIENNTVYRNSGDGLATALSRDNTFSRNNVFENRVGIRLDEGDASGTAVTGNSVSRNNKAAENVQLDASNIVQNNGGQWNMQVLIFIWAGVALCVVAFSILFLLARIRRKKNPRPSLMLV